MDVEAVLLTGGESRRMGEDKASIQLEGESLAERILAQFDAVGVPVTILGREPIEERPFLKDEEEFQGPAAALARFEPTKPLVFVCSCDIPNFDSKIVTLMAKTIDRQDALIPAIKERDQFLCAMYRAKVFDHLRESQSRSMRRAVVGLEIRRVFANEFEDAGIDPLSILGANTPEELKEASRKNNE